MTLARAFHRIEESVTDVRRLGDCYFVGMNLEMVSSHQKKQKEREDENDKISVTFFYKDVEKAKSKENEYDLIYF